MNVAISLRQTSTVIILYSIKILLTSHLDWYDNEHAPVRLTVPGFINGVRYKATDSTAPSWLATYDLTSPSVASSEPYKALAAKASDRERDLISRLATLNRRIYKSYSIRVDPHIAQDALPGKFIIIVEVLVQPELEEEFNRWYEEEHIPLLSKVTGWHRTRRYKLISSIELADGTSDDPVPNYLTIHEWTNTPELKLLKAATTTPWSTKMLKEVSKVISRQFTTYSIFQKPE